MSGADWYEVTRLGDGITMIGEPRHVEAVKSYLIEGSRDVAVLDTGLGIGDFPALVATLTQRDPIVLQTHGHWDHIGHSHTFRRVLIHPSEAYALRRGFPNQMYRPLVSRDRIAAGGLPDSFDPSTAAIPPTEPTGELHHGDTFDLGDRILDVFHTPGHSPGGVSFLDRKTRLLFAGDAINYGDIWLFLPRSDAVAFRSTIRMLAELADRADAVYSGHGAVPIRPDDVRAMHAAFEDVWNGRQPDRHLDWDIGFPDKVPVDAHDFGSFTFLLATGRYGGDGESRVI